MSVFWYMNSHTNEKRKETLASMCDKWARMLQDQFNVSANHLQALVILVSTFQHGKNPSAIDQMTFARYTERTAFERPLYVVKVLHAERAQFEKQQGWTIKRMDTHERSPIHEEYAPVIFAQLDCDNVMRARASGMGFSQLLSGY